MDNKDQHSGFDEIRSGAEDFKNEISHQFTKEELEHDLKHAFSASGPTNPRPLVISIICVIGFIAGLFVLLALANDFPVSIKEDPTWTLFALFVPLIGLLGIFLVWKMKKLGVYIYVAMAVVNLAVNLIWGHVALLPIVIQLSIALTYLYYFRKMD